MAAEAFGLGDDAAQQRVGGAGVGGVARSEGAREAPRGVVERHRHAVEPRIAQRDGACAPGFGEKGVQRVGVAPGAGGRLAVWVAAAEVGHLGLWREGLEAERRGGRVR